MERGNYTREWLCKIWKARNGKQGRARWIKMDSRKRAGGKFEARRGERALNGEEPEDRMGKRNRPWHEARPTNASYEVARKNKRGRNPGGRLNGMIKALI